MSAFNPWVILTSLALWIVILSPLFFVLKLAGVI